MDMFNGQSTEWETVNDARWPDSSKTVWVSDYMFFSTDYFSSMKLSWVETNNNSTGTNGSKKERCLRQKGKIQVGFPSR